MKKFFLFLMATGIMISCTEQPSKSVIEKAPIDALMATWENTWNNQDSVGFKNQFTENALLIDDNLIAIGTDQINTKFIRAFINVVTNIKDVKLKDWSTNDMAGYTGTYSLEVVVNKQVVNRGTGAVTINWVKTEKGEWKITTAVIHSFPTAK